MGQEDYNGESNIVENYIAIAVEAVGNTNNIMDCINMHLLEAYSNADTKKIDVLNGLLNDIKLLMMPVNGLEH